MQLAEGVNFVFVRFSLYYAMVFCRVLSDNPVMYIQTGSKYSSMQVAVEKLCISIRTAKLYPW